ncbi:macrophage migration inhibitory factor-like isoform X2 [Panulirus ornatus]|uniref:macrophage migration inhibitory factor-like isoform X2 n=1 Tax=Panulirus ornatus TaxID=150431 RepID=UPI003A8AB6CE
MPSLEIATNVPKDKVTPTLLLELSKVFSATVSKSEQYCCVRVVPDQLMTFGGSTEPCALAVLHCIGELGVEENKAHAAKIYEFMEKNLGIPSDRMYLTFVDLPTSLVGYQGTTFHEILGR